MARLTWNTATSDITYAPYTTNGQQSLVQCGDPQQVQLVATRVFQFCYFLSGPNYTVVATGYITSEYLAVTVAGNDGNPTTF